MTLRTKPAKPRKCPECKQPYAKTRAVQPTCGALPCQESYALKVAHKAAWKREKMQRAADRAQRETLKTRSQWVKEAQIAFNRYVRARDKKAGFVCISSGRNLDWNANEVDSGHYRSVGSSPHLRFNENNCHAQSKKDNRYGSGCAVEYRKGLIQRIGIAAVEELEADQSTKKFTIDDLKEIKRKYIALRKAVENTL